MRSLGQLFPDRVTAGGGLQAVPYLDPFEVFSALAEFEPEGPPGDDGAPPPRVILVMEGATEYLLPPESAGAGGSDRFYTLLRTHQGGLASSAEGAWARSHVVFLEAENAMFGRIHQIGPQKAQPKPSLKDIESYFFQTLLQNGAIARSQDGAKSETDAVSAAEMEALRAVLGPRMSDGMLERAIRAGVSPEDVTQVMPEGRSFRQVAQQLVGLSFEAAKNMIGPTVVELLRARQDGVEQPRIDFKRLSKRRFEHFKVPGVYLEDADARRMLSEVVGAEQALTTLYREAALMAHQSTLKDHGIVTEAGGYPLHLLVGVPGMGKSLTVQFVAAQLGVPLVRLSMAELYASSGGILGQTEQAIQAALGTLRAMAEGGDVIVWVDEMEKAIASSEGGRSTDGGTSQRGAAELLQALQEDGLGLVIGTINDIASLSGPMLNRAQSTHFYGYPSKEQLARIWEVAVQRYAPGSKLSAADYQALAEKRPALVGRDADKLVRTAVGKALVPDARPGAGLDLSALKKGLSRSDLEAALDGYRSTFEVDPDKIWDIIAQGQGYPSAGGGPLINPATGTPFAAADQAKLDEHKAAAARRRGGAARARRRPTSPCEELSMKIIDSSTTNFLRAAPGTAPKAAAQTNAPAVGDAWVADAEVALRGTTLEALESKIDAAIEVLRQTNDDGFDVAYQEKIVGDPFMMAVWRAYVRQVVAGAVAASDVRRGSVEIMSERFRLIGYLETVREKIRDMAEERQGAPARLTHLALNLRDYNRTLADTIGAEGWHDLASANLQAADSLPPEEQRPFFFRAARAAARVDQPEVMAKLLEGQNADKKHRLQFDAIEKAVRVLEQATQRLVASGLSKGALTATRPNPLSEMECLADQHAHPDLVRLRVDALLMSFSGPAGNKGKARFLEEVDARIEALASRTGPVAGAKEAGPLEVARWLASDGSPDVPELMTRLPDLVAALMSPGGEDGDVADGTLSAEAIAAARSVMSSGLTKLARVYADLDDPKAQKAHAECIEAFATCLQFFLAGPPKEFPAVFGPLVAEAARNPATVQMVMDWPQKYHDLGLLDPVPAFGAKVRVVEGLIAKGDFEAAYERSRGDAFAGAPGEFVFEAHQAAAEAVSTGRFQPKDGDEASPMDVWFAQSHLAALRALDSVTDGYALRRRSQLLKSLAVREPPLGLDEVAALQDDMGPALSIGVAAELAALYGRHPDDVDAMQAVVDLVRAWRGAVDSSTEDDKGSTLRDDGYRLLETLSHLELASGVIRPLLMEPGRLWNVRVPRGRDRTIHLAEQVLPRLGPWVDRLEWAEHLADACERLDLSKASDIWVAARIAGGLAQDEAGFAQAAALAEQVFDALPEDQSTIAMNQVWAATRAEVALRLAYPNLSSPDAIAALLDKNVGDRHLVGVVKRVNTTEVLTAVMAAVTNDDLKRILARGEDDVDAATPDTRISADLPDVAL